MRRPSRIGTIMWTGYLKIASCVSGTRAALACSYGIRATRAIFCCTRAFPALGSNLYPQPFAACIFIAIRVHARSSSSKQALLAGKLVAGGGNIYALEGLFRAGMHPAKTAARISAPRYIKLAGAIRATLSEAIAKGGSTWRGFKDSSGE